MTHYKYDRDKPYFYGLFWIASARAIGWLNTGVIRESGILSFLLR